VVAGEVTRTELQKALDDTGDAEPAIALEYLDTLDKITKTMDSMK
jgi:hypothetical protein